MSDILIKNMKMPENCVGCPLAKNYGMCAITKKQFNWGNPNRLSDCPLIEVPTPHGRLGDLDKLEQMFADIDNAPYSAFDGEEPFYTAEDAAQIIRLSSTIIEGEGEE